MNYSRNIWMIAVMVVVASGCATPSEPTKYDNRTDAITRMCGGGASYLNTATFKLELDKFVKQGVGSGSLETNSGLKTALMTHPAVTESNLDSIFKTFTKCVTQNNLLPSGDGNNASIIMGDGNTTGDNTAIVE